MIVWRVISRYPATVLWMVLAFAVLAVVLAAVLHASPGPAPGHVILVHTGRH